MYMAYYWSVARMHCYQSVIVTVFGRFLRVFGLHLRQPFTDAEAEQSSHQSGTSGCMHAYSTKPGQCVKLVLPMLDSLRVFDSVNVRFHIYEFITAHLS